MPRWRDRRGAGPRGPGLSPAARAFRATHAAIAAGMLVALGHVWCCALTGRRGRALRIARCVLLGEGLLVGANHGDCPLGPLQARLGDPVPLFELLLSPRAARRAVPVLGATAAGGLAVVWGRDHTGARVRG
jgi:hypothetical protein